MCRYRKLKIDDVGENERNCRQRWEKMIKTVRRVRIKEVQQSKETKNDFLQIKAHSRHFDTRDATLFI